MRSERLEQNEKLAEPTEFGLVSQVMASFTKIISAEMAVLNRSPSKSSVTFLIQAWSVLSWAHWARYQQSRAEMDFLQQFRTFLRLGS